MRAAPKMRTFLIGLALSAFSLADNTQAQRDAPVVLPRPEASFQGKIGKSAKDSVSAWPEPITAPKGAPNILLILLDDIGFGDTSTFGGLAQTPALDQLAAEGLKYNRFHVVGLCSPTRAALLSGRNHHRVGFGTVGEAGFPGYNGVWKKSTVPVAEILRRNGYATAAFGKWHNTPFNEISPVGPFDRWATGLGFEYYYGNMLGASSQWEPPLWRNTLPVQQPKTIKQGYHYTADIVDEAVGWLHTQQSLAPDKPYFLYLATGATHSPHHVPKAWIEKYRGKFDQGWEKLREEIFARQKKLGVIPPDAKLTPSPKELTSWDSLSADEKRIFARQMEVYAAFVTHTDSEVGRLIDAVRNNPGGDNTLILYIVGDNGASAEAFEGAGLPPIPIQERLKLLDELGGPKYGSHQAAGWALAGNTPFQWGKGIASHFGGTRNPLVVSWPAGIKDKGGLRTQFTHVNDIAGTLYEVTGVQMPDIVDGVKQQPLDGTSFAYSFGDSNAPSRHRVQYFEIWGNRALYKDGWVAAARHRPPWNVPSGLSSEDFDPWESFRDDPWELYHIDKDFSQAENLADRYPEKLKELQTLFEDEARKNGVYPLISKNLYLSTPPPPKQSSQTFTYYPGLPSTPAFNVPQLPRPSLAKGHSYFGRAARDFNIRAEVTIPETGAEGAIVALGGGAAGFSLYVQDGYLIFENKAGGSCEVLRSNKKVPAGKAVLGFYFVHEDLKESASGTGYLYVNEQLAGSTKLKNGMVLFSTENFDIGRDSAAPVSEEYEAPFAFTGLIVKVDFTLK